MVYLNMKNEYISRAARAYIDSGAGKELARIMTSLYNPLHDRKNLSSRERDARISYDFRALGFMYLFKGDKEKARNYFEIAYSMGPDKITIQKQKLIFDKWEDVCQIIAASREAIDKLRREKKRVPLNELLE